MMKNTTVMIPAAMGSAPRCSMVALIVSKKSAIPISPNRKKPSQLAQPTGRYLRVPTLSAAGA